jgi:hypothetical protein
MASPFPPSPPGTGVLPPSQAIVPRLVPGGAGASWWASGWRLFARSVPTWFGIALAYLAISVALGKIPFIGAAAEWLLTPVFLGGIMLGCDALQRGERLRFSHLFDGFGSQHFVPLLLVGVFNLGLTLLAFLVGVVVIASGIEVSGSVSFGSLATDPSRILRTFGLASFVMVAVAMLVLAGIAMANWFAPALIVLRDARPGAAMLASLRSCLRNWLPFLAYGAIGIGISIVASLAFVALTGMIGFGTVLAIIDGTASWASIGLGLALLAGVYLAFLIVIATVIAGSTYAGYRDTLAAEPPPPVAP